MKAKGGRAGFATQRYRPASDFDNDTLTQKREYWRNKKREQRARVAESRKAWPRHDGRGGPKQQQQQQQAGDACGASQTSACKAAAFSPAHKRPNSGNAVNVSLASPRGKKEGVRCAGDSGPSQKERWFQTMKLNQVLPQFAANRASAPDQDSVKCQAAAGGAAGGYVTSPRSRPSGAPSDISAPSVPPNRATAQPSGTGAACQLQSKTSTQGSSSTARQGVPLAKAQHKAQAVCIQPKPLNMDVTAGLKLLSPSSSTHLAGRSGGGGGGGVVGVAGQTGPRKSALGAGDDGRAGSADKPRAATETEEERAAKRREQWRIKKRVQRAKVAARSGKSRERAPCAPTPPQRTGGLSPVRTAGQKQSAGGPMAPDAVLCRFPKSDRVTVDSSAAPRLAAAAVKIEEKSEGLLLQSALLNPADPGPNQNTVFIKVENQPAARKTQSTCAPSVAGDRRAEPTRRFSNHTYFSNVGRGVARCRTPRQRFVETQKCFSNQRSVRVKYPSLAAIYSSRNIPRVLPNESPEQTASRRREYWRVKKREQRAKQSLEVKNRLKEKDSLMRRVKRYQKILEEMRRARAQTAAALEGSRVCGGDGDSGLTGLTHASETIGGFIKEDGTVTVSLPLSPAAGAMTGREDGLTSDDDIAVARSPNPPRVGSLAHRGGVALGGHRPPPLLRPAQVRVSPPGGGGQLASRPPRLLSIRPRAPSPRSGEAGCANPAPRSVAHSPSQITLTHPPFPRDAGSDLPGAGGCVMKMAVSSLLAAPPPPDDPELTEEQRMAKKREYWRVKKREQRAARATKLKHGLSMARGGNAAAHRRKILKQTQSGNAAAARHKANTLASSHANVPHAQQARPIKVERDAVPGPDLHAPPDPAICPVKPPQTAPPQTEPDPTLSAETQATTLLAVASMKKLLEESLSTVAECQPAADIKTERSPPPCKTETEGYVSEEQQEVKPSIPAAVCLGDEEEDKLPLAANLTLQIKSWQDPYLADASCQTGGPPSPQCCSAVKEEGPALTSSPPRRAKRLCAKKAGNLHHHQQCCSPEPPKLHHPHAIAEPTPSPQKAQMRPTHSQPSSQQQQQQHHGRRPTDLGPVGAGGGLSSVSSLQSKREYWKLMKRQQRARSKARQKGSLGYRPTSRLLLSQSNAQTLNPLTVHNTQSSRSQTQPIKRTLQPKSPSATLTAVHSIPTLLVVSPSGGGGGGGGGRCPDLLQVKPPGSSFTSSPSGGRGEGSGATCHPDVSLTSRTAEGGVGVQRSEGAGSDGTLRLVEHRPEPTQGFSAAAATTDGARVRRWTVQESYNAAPALATLTPPDNPLASINLLPMEPLVVDTPGPGCRSSNGGLRKPAFAPPPPPRTPQQASPAKLLPISTLAPPKPIPGETQEDFLRRKREYWRVKKKEQRARKAIRDRELSQRRAPGNWKPIRPAKDPYRPQCAETQDLGDCETSYEDPEHLMSSTSDAEMGYFSYPSYNTPIEGEYDNADGCFADGDQHGGVGDNFSPTADDGDGGGDAWRSRYLMDHDPLNQLLVCMVCGDLLYSHSLEGVRAHIEEAHPDTLNLEPPECRRILDAWDEQVSQRERFFTSQLRHHGGGHLAEANGT